MRDGLAGKASTSRQAFRPGPDWGYGCYEETADALVEAAEVVVQTGQLWPGARVLDIGCGAGTAALIAVAAGAEVVGVDPAGRLLQVATDKAIEAGQRIDFRQGEAGALPVDKASVDVALSNFGLIFAPVASAVAAELHRVLVPGGRAVFSAWLPEGTLTDVAATLVNLVQPARESAEPAFAWHDHRALVELFGTHDMPVEVERHTLAITAPSARAYVERQRRSHPLVKGAFDVLEASGEGEAALSRLLGILDDGNEDESGFRTSADYVIVTVKRGLD